MNHVKLLLNDNDEPPLKKYLILCTIAYFAVLLFSIIQYTITSNIVSNHTIAKNKLVYYRYNLGLIYELKNKKNEPYCPNFYSNPTFCEELT